MENKKNVRLLSIAHDFLFEHLPDLLHFGNVFEGILGQ